MKKMRLYALAVALTTMASTGAPVVSTAAPASDKGEFSVWLVGIGSKSCAHWTSSPDLKAKGQDWALGFWSALNYVASATKTRSQLMIDPDIMFADIEKMCALRPNQSLADTVWLTFLTKSQ
jgi:hypothetical protein